MELFYFYGSFEIKNKSSFQNFDPKPSSCMLQLLVELDTESNMERHFIWQISVKGMDIGL